MTTRDFVAHAAADALAKIAEPGAALVGFDGFIDSILHMVDVRTDMSPTGYKRLTTISAFAARCAAAAGRSTNIEQVLMEDRFGGNGPLMAGALGRLGMDVTYIGAVAGIGAVAVAGGGGGGGGGSGGVEGKGEVHPVFAPFARRCNAVWAVAPPSRTDCLEFEDGKLMFNNTANIQDVTWDRLVERVGLDTITAMVEHSTLLGIVNWSLQGGIPGIWLGLMRDVFPQLREVGTGGGADAGGDAGKRSKRVFIDLSDPAKRTDGDIADALELLTRLEKTGAVRVTLGLNLSEATRIAAVAGVDAFGKHTNITMGDGLVLAAKAIRERLQLDCVVVHPREGAAAADAAGHAAWFEGPFTAHPKLSTGAGDHFNGGFAFAQVNGLPLEGCLAAACATSGAYVRNAESPTRERLISFLRNLPITQR